MSKTNKQQVPKIRFEGFSENWSEFKIGNITSSYSGGTPSVTEGSYYKGDIPFIRSGEIDSKETELFITELGLKNSSAKMVEKGDILYALYGATSGEVSRSKIKGAINQAILAIKPKTQFCSECLCQLLGFMKDGIVKKYLQGGQGNLSGAIIKDLKIALPDLKEQIQIGDFFQQLDKLIELQTRAVGSAETYKKAMLQKMFPQKGEKVPCVRFEGFSEDWVEKALSRIVNISSGVTGDTSLSKGKYFVTRIETIADGVINFNKVGFLNEKPDDRFLLVKGDILYSNINSLNHIGKVALFNDDKELYHGINLLRLIPMKDKIEPLFLFISMLTKDKLDWAKRHANQAVSQASINQTTLGQQYFYLPSILEQTQIGNFFQKLDQNIEAQKQKLEKYRDMKKALLQRMFV